MGVEQFSNECRKTKTIEITPANHNKNKLPNKPGANKCTRRQARENACDQVTVGLSFTFDWSRKGARFFNQSQSEVKQNQSKTHITFDSQLKTALMQHSYTIRSWWHYLPAVQM